MYTRQVPSSGESIPVIGCGTYAGFDAAAGSPKYARLTGVIQSLFEAGGCVIDSSPMYGLAEAVTGEVLARTNDRGRAFLATKVWTRGRNAGVAQMQTSMRLLGVERMDLMQIHNLLDWRAHLPTLLEWKERGLVRYIGISHYTASAYRELEAVMRAETFDFLQVNYALDDREAEDRILPLAAARGMAVLVNVPLGSGALIRRLNPTPLPVWAGEIGATSWAQVLLKFAISHPAVTCAIPGTSRPEHMAENARAGHGLIPERSFWEDVLESI